MAEPVFVPVETRPERRPLLGYAMVMTAATLWAVNGTVSKVILTSGLSSLRLAEVRSAGAFAVLAVVLAAQIVVLRRLALAPALRAGVDT